MTPAPRALPVIKRSRLNELIRQVDTDIVRDYGGCSQPRPAHLHLISDAAVEAMRGRSFVCAGPEAPHPTDPGAKVCCPAVALQPNTGGGSWGCRFDNKMFAEFSEHPWWQENRYRDNIHLVVRIEEDV